MADPVFTQQEVDDLIAKKKEKFNAYATNKSVGQGLSNTTVILNNIQILVTVCAGSYLNNFEIAVIILVVAMLILSLFTYILIIFLSAIKTDYKIEISDYKVLKAKHLNMMVTFLFGIILIVNGTINIVVAFT